MVDENWADLPPLQGCLYCHSEGTTILIASRKVLGLGSDLPMVRCNHCQAVAVLDVDPQNLKNWRIRYRRISHDPRYYYVKLYLGKAGWLLAQDALEISTRGYIQRKRVQQARDGDLGWLQAAPLFPPPPLMSTSERVYLALRAVSLQQTPPSGILSRPESGSILDTGKFYVTESKLHLLGQRRDWSHRLDDICAVTYSDTAWMVRLNTPGQPQHYQGLNLYDQMDAQLVASVVETLWKGRQTARDTVSSY